MGIPAEPARRHPDSTTQQETATFRQHLCDGLQKRPRQLSPHYLYDALGSALFDAICHLPWYPITRAEKRLLTAAGPEIARRVSAPRTVVELGCGSGEKLVALMRALSPRDTKSSQHEGTKNTSLRIQTSDARPRGHEEDRHEKERHEGCAVGGGQRPGSDRGDQRAELARSWLERLVSRVALIDVSPAALDRTRHAVAMLGRVPVTCFEMTYGEGLEAAAGDGQLAPPRLVLFLGSNIGNFDPAEAALFLAHARRSLAPDDRLLLGVDLVKPVAALLDAYDDPLGVTAAFNKNLLARANRELGTNFDLRAFAHRASWNARHSRVEMHLVSLRRQAVHVPGSCTIVLDEGELIWTESSYKYTEEGIDELAQQAGLRIEQKWVDRQAGFELALLGRQ